MTTSAAGSARAWALLVGLAACGDAGGGDEATGDATTPDTPTDAAPTGDASLPTGGDTDQAGTTEAPPPLGPCEQAHPGDQVVRRLSNSEFNATIQDLFGAGVVHSPAALLPYEGDGNGFTNDTALLTVSWQHVQQYLATSEAIAADVIAALPALLPCAATAGVDPIADRACAGGFIDGHGPRAYRRPLVAGERDALLLAYDDAIAAGEGFSGGVARVITQALQSPAFLYRVELGAGPFDDVADRLTPHETAARLSYLLWGSMPDDELFAAAAADALATPDEIAAQAERMLGDPRARRRVRQLHREWLRLGAVVDVQRDAAVFPGFDALKWMLVAQAERFAESIVFDDPDGDVRALLTSAKTLLNADLAPLYGVDPAAAGLSPEDGDPATDEFEAVDLDPTQRAGILTHAAILGALAKPTAPAPVLRGKYVLEHLLCFMPPPPPPDVVMQPPDGALGNTTRERWAALTEAEGSQCAACHAIINGPGHAFGHYSAVGQWMPDEGGFPIDPAAGFVGLPIAGEFADAVDMMDQLAASPAVRACVLDHWFRFAYGRRPQGDQDACTIDELDARFTASDGDLRDLLIAMTQTDAFRRRPNGGSP
ncbi:MAG: DUF1592 domain-containing protein [Myxococcales bacterium]|nr:DUF1592 domain-containing protein [Myxococcales bacterium]